MSFIMIHPNSFLPSDISPYPSSSCQLQFNGVNPLSGWLGRSHQLANRFEDVLDLFVVPFAYSGESVHLFRRKASTCSEDNRPGLSERSDAGVSYFSES
jgi:hypothetical protein